MTQTVLFRVAFWVKSYVKRFQCQRKVHVGFCLSVQSLSVESKPREYQLDIYSPLSKPSCVRLVGVTQERDIKGKARLLGKMKNLTLFSTPFSHLRCLKSKVLYSDGQNIFDILLQRWFKNNTKSELNTRLLSPSAFNYFTFFVINIDNRMGPSKIHDY